MSELAEQLGVEWRLLLTQGVNFFVLLAALSILVYRPLLRILKERRKNIELGLKGAEEVRRRLDEIKAERAQARAAAEREVAALIAAAEREAKIRAEELVKTANARAAALMAEAAKTAERKRLAALAELRGEAAGLVKSALIKAVGLEPDAVDEELIRKAVESLPS